jgi:acetolactate synthase-1/2/3 large subunit
VDHVVECRREPPADGAEMESVRPARVSHVEGSPPWATRYPAASRRARPIVDRPAVAFTGDGGFLMSIAEPQTAQRENLPIVMLVFDDQEPP